MWRYFSIYFPITGVQKSFVIPRTSFNIQRFVYLYRGSTVMASFLCYDNSDVVVTLIITTDFHLNLIQLWL